MRCALPAIAALMTIVADGQDLPDSPGKPVVEKLCGHCHAIATVVGLRRTRSAWETTVDEMVSRGATGNDAEFETVVVYLAKYFGKANVNQATPEEIQEIVGLSAAEADAIVNFRAAHGTFKDLTGLKQVPNVDAARLEERKDRIAFR